MVVAPSLCQSVYISDISHNQTSKKSFTPKQKKTVIYLKYRDIPSFVSDDQFVVTIVVDVSKSDTLPNDTTIKIKL